MNYCNGNHGSGKVCNGGAFRTASETQSGWAQCYGGNGHFGTRAQHLHQRQLRRGQRVRDQWATA